MTNYSHFLLQWILLIGIHHEEKERAQIQHSQYVNEDSKWGLQQGRFIDTQIWQRFGATEMLFHFFGIGTSSLATSNISISFMILLAITSWFADTILRDIKSNSSPKFTTKKELLTLGRKMQKPNFFLISAFHHNSSWVNLSLWDSQVLCCFISWCTVIRFESIYTHHWHPWVLLRLLSR